MQQHVENLEAAIVNRHSVRAFLPDAVDSQTLSNILRLAQHAPSNCNAQPWKLLVVSGAAKARLQRAFAAAIIAGQQPRPDYGDMPFSHFSGRYRERQVASACELYDKLGIERNETEKRDLALLRNYQFFDAPHAIILAMDNCFGVPIALDLGIYLQTLMLAMMRYGVSSCPQAALALYPSVLRDELGIDASRQIVAGLSFGYEDTAATVNSVRQPRAPLSEVVQFIDG
ncbi:MAG: nitroreductase [Motiliproteus sp.]